MNDSPQALIVNCFTPRNLGDAAIVDGLAALLRAAGYGHITVATMYPDDDWTGLGIDEVVPSLFRAAHRSRVRQSFALLASVVRATTGLVGRSDRSVESYRHADIVISVGGGYLGAGRVLTNLLAGLNVAYGAWLGKRTVAAPMSIRPCSRAVRFVLGVLLRRTQVFARDHLSARIFLASGLRAEVASDLALNSPSLMSDWAAAPTNVIGWAPRVFARDHQIGWSDERAADELKRLSMDGFEIVLITQCTAPTADDRPAVTKVAAMIPGARILPAATNLTEARMQYASVSALVASRLHAGIGSMLSGRPALAVAYEEKVAGFYADLGLSDWVLDEPDGLAQRLRSVIGTRPEVTADWTAFRTAIALHSPK